MSWIFPRAFVFTGPPCSGKTTIMDKISQQTGFFSIEETGRQLIREAQQGLIPDPRVDEHTFTLRVFDRQLQKEELIDPSVPHLLDRALIDCLAHARCTGNTLDTGSLALLRRYRSVFVFAPLPFVDDDARNDFDRNNQQALYRELITTYSDYGHELLIVPVGTVEERTSLVLDRITQQLNSPAEPNFLSRSAASKPRGHDL